MTMQKYFKDKTVLVTGAAGFLGSHLVERLLELGAKVIGVDNFLTGRKQNLAAFEENTSFTFIEADATQPPTEYLPDVTIDAVLHFASPASPPAYQRMPVETYLINSIGTHNLAQYLLDKNPEARLLFASTSEVYGDPQVHPQPESYWGNVNPNGVRACYDESKRMGETICGVHFRDFSLDTRLVRIFNTYGPRMNPEDGRVIPNFVMQALRGEKITIYGEGTQTRSYCYVTDLVEGILTFLSKDNLAGETINIGNPDEYTVKQTADIINQQVSQVQQREKLEFIHLPLPKDDPTQRQPDITKAKKLLEWQPSVSFEEGLKKTIAYFNSEVSI